MGMAPDEHHPLSEADVAAFAIMFSEFEGNEFDLSTMRFKESK